MQNARRTVLVERVWGVEGLAPMYVARPSTPRARRQWFCLAEIENLSTDVTNALIEKVPRPKAQAPTWRFVAAA